ncbi:unannotated protein [freshwater metagenome]|uniref:Unannotated protein n=1 Tax=freshwater metagenome TaxID=449393 RepID=A0A6J7GK85_9ZZZZ
MRREPRDRRIGEDVEDQSVPPRGLRGDDQDEQQRRGPERGRKDRYRSTGPEGGELERDADPAGGR